MSDSLFDSAKSWIGDVQVGWELTPLKHFTGFINGAAFKPDEWQDSGVPIVRIENLNGSTEFNFTRRAVPAKFHVRRGDLLFGWSGNKGTSFGPYLWQHDGHYYLNQHIFRMTGFRGHKGWFYWVLKAVTHEIESRVHGIIGLVHVTRPELGSTLIPVPPAPTQVLISSFLDRGVAAIDDLIAKKERLIELLQEKRQALITQAVTKGLDPNVPMKDSGVEGIGRVPAGWNLMPLKRVLSYGPKNGISPSSSDEARVPSFSIAAVRDGGVDVEGNLKFVDIPVAEASRYLIREQDILLVRGNGNLNLVGTCGLVRHFPSGCTYPDILMLLRPNQHALASFLTAAINSPYVRAQIEARAQTSNGTYKLSGEDVSSLFVVVPSLQTQSLLCEVIARADQSTRTTAGSISTQIQLLQEYRQALITAAVTGKLDIPATPEGDVDGQAQRMGI